MAQDSGVRFSWQTIIMTIGLVLTMVGGFWYLAYIPIDQRLNALDRSIAELRMSEARHASEDETKFLTQKEHNEFKQNVRDADSRVAAEIKDLGLTIAKQKSELISRNDLQQSLNLTRAEFLSEVKRLDALEKDNMKRKEFDAWKSERDKILASTQDRQNRFSEALDAMYSKLMQQIPSYQRPQ